MTVPAPAATHQPYISPTQSPAELTPRAIALGVLLGLIFGASNVYLALKIGLTVSASIPIAVLSIMIFRWLGRSTILENNIVQTTGSAADSVSAGGGFTIPAGLFVGYDLDIGRLTVLAIAGGGVPGLRRAHAGDQAVRQRHDRADVRHDQADPRHVRGRDPGGVRVLHRRRRGGQRRDYRAGAVAADDHRGVSRRVRRHARQSPRPSSYREAPHR